MPILHRGTHICEKCGKEFEWVHFELIRQPITSSMLQVEKIPNEAKAYLFDNFGYDAFEVGVNCKHCHYDNRFVYKSDNQIR